MDADSDAATLLPNAIGIGVERGGTSWLMSCLREHPQVLAPKHRKELNFFNNEFDRGCDWYRSFFEDDFNGQPVIMEYTPTYMIHGEAIQRIRDTVPSAKLVVILRNPFDRAYSAYNLYSIKGKTDGTFREHLEKRSFIVDGSMYAPRIERLFSTFPREQIGIFFYDDLERDSLAFFQSVCRFLEIDDAFVPPSLAERRNVSGNVSRQKLAEKLGGGKIGNGWPKRV